MKSISTFHRRFSLRIVSSWTALATLLAGCSGLEVLNVFSGTPKTLPVTLAYGESDRQRVDIYPVLQRHASPSNQEAFHNKAVAVASETPLNTQSALRPVVVFFYGGAWNSGSRNDYGFIAKTFNELGYVVAIPDYRLTPEVVYPDFVRDSAAAVSLVMSQIREFGGDPDRIVLAGHSAGAYNALMLAMDPRWMGEQERRRIRGVIGLSSPVNFLPIQMPEARLAFSWPDTPRDTQPIEHVSQNLPPILLISARKDPLVDPQINTMALADRLRAAQVSVEVEIYDNPLGLIRHATLVATLSQRFSFLAPSIAKIQGFIDRVTE